MQLPNKLTSGQPFKSAIVRTVNNIIDYLRSQRIVGDGKTIRVNQGTNGLTLSATAEGGGGKTEQNTQIINNGGVVTCVIGQGISQDGVFVATAYPNGLGTQPSETVLLTFGEYALTSALTTGSVVVANAISLKAIGEG